MLKWTYTVFLVFAAMFRESGFIMGGQLSSEPLYEWNVPFTLLFAVTAAVIIVMEKIQKVVKKRIVNRN